MTHLVLLAAFIAHDGPLSLQGFAITAGIPAIPVRLNAEHCARATPNLTGYSHSMVPGGLLVTSSTTRLTSGTSLVIRVEIRSSTS